MSKSAEAQSEPEEVLRRWKEEAAVVEHWGYFIERHFGGLWDTQVAACFIVAMLGPKLDAIRGELVDLQNQLDGMRTVER